MFFATSFTEARAVFLFTVNGAIFARAGFVDDFLEHDAKVVGSAGKEHGETDGDDEEQREHAPSPTGERGEYGCSASHQGASLGARGERVQHDQDRQGIYQRHVKTCQVAALLVLFVIALSCSTSDSGEGWPATEEHVHGSASTLSAPQLDETIRRARFGDTSNEKGWAS